MIRSKDKNVEIREYNYSKSDDALHFMSGNLIRYRYTMEYFQKNNMLYFKKY